MDVTAGVGARFDALRVRSRTFRALGLGNLVRIARYRLGKRSGWLVRRTPIGPSPEGPFLRDRAATNDVGVQSVRYFSRHEIAFETGPDWFRNPWHAEPIERDRRHWSEVPDFARAVGDIKGLWEPSRFDWAPRWAWRIAREGVAEDRVPLESWLRDWCRQNPPNEGFNWKCAQETSLRALNVLLSAWILDGPGAPLRAGLLAFLEDHVRRVLPTVHYAIAQANNHATSEATGLFVIGCVLCRDGTSGQRALGERARRRGRRMLDERIGALVLEDGSFSQHSLTYHRMVLDTLVFAELARRVFDEPPFAERTLGRLDAAARWLADLVDRETGDGPNLGANDGAYLFDAFGQPYRDFRPSLDIALASFSGARLEGDVRHVFHELFDTRRDSLRVLPERGSVCHRDGGYAVLKSGHACALLRLPRYAFRPSHSDALHLDLRIGGINMLRDGGSYSYNPDDPALGAYFPGVLSHNTVSFDDRDQMPRLSRFLYGAWLTPSELDFDAAASSATAAYVDHRDCRHRRRVILQDDACVVRDVFGGFERHAELRWRLAPGTWRLDGDALEGRPEGGGVTVRIEVSGDTRHVLGVVEEWESRHYLERTPVPVLVVRIEAGDARGSCTIETRLGVVREA